MSASPAFHSARAGFGCERTTWLTAQAATLGLRSALTSSASSRRAVRPQALGERVALGDERVERQAVEGVGVVRRHGATRRSSSERPVISAGCSMPSSSSSVGATSARTPPSRSVDARRR